MIAVLLVTALFVFISIYFFFRTEKLQRTITSMKRDASKTQQENQVFSKSMALIAGSTEEFTKKRLQCLLDKSKCSNTINQLTLIKPIIHNYAVIFKECLVKKGKLQSTIKKCFSSLEEDTYQEFFETCIKKDSKIQRLWNSNNFIGFISLVEALLVKYEEEVHSHSTVK